MTPDAMLDTLNTAGEDAGADFHDGLNGWFGWSVTQVRNSASGEHIRWELKLTFEPAGEDGDVDTTAKVVAEWELFPLEKRSYWPRPTAPSTGSPLRGES